jgi:Uncharacterized alpha/beta hydrolase domain (DUF2235)
VTKRLMFFFDGSSNKAAGPTDIIPTNVFQLNRALTYGFGGPPQIKFYFSGVGTRRDYTSAATGRGFDEIIIEAYVNLASTWMETRSTYLGFREVPLQPEPSAALCRTRACSLLTTWTLSLSCGDTSAMTASVRRTAINCC